MITLTREQFNEFNKFAKRHGLWCNAEACKDFDSVFKIQEDAFVITRSLIETIDSNRAEIDKKLDQKVI